MTFISDRTLNLTYVKANWHPDCVQHTQNSKNYMIFGRDASFTSLSEDIHCRRVRWSEVRLYYRNLT